MTLLSPPFSSFVYSCQVCSEFSLDKLWSISQTGQTSDLHKRSQSKEHACSVWLTSLVEEEQRKEPNIETFWTIEFTTFYTKSSEVMKMIDHTTTNQLETPFHLSVFRPNRCELLIQIGKLHERYNLKVKTPKEKFLLFGLSVYLTIALN